MSFRWETKGCAIPNRGKTQFETQSAIRKGSRDPDRQKLKKNGSPRYDFPKQSFSTKNQASSHPFNLRRCHSKKTRTFWPKPSIFEASGATIHPSLRKKLTTAGNGLVVNGSVPEGQCLLRAWGPWTKWCVTLVEKKLDETQPVCFKRTQPILWFQDECFFIFVIDRDIGKH